LNTHLISLDCWTETREQCQTEVLSRVSLGRTSAGRGMEAASRIKRQSGCGRADGGRKLDQLTAAADNE